MGSRTLAGLLAVAAASLPAGAALGSPGHTAPTRAQAVAALQHAQSLLAGHGDRTGRELTPALAQLYASLSQLGASDRRAGEALLARPDGPGPDPPGTHKWNGPEALGSPACAGKFCVHWTLAPPDNPSPVDTNVNSVPDYVDKMLDIFVREVYPCENGIAPTACAGSPGLGWRDPVSDGVLGTTSQLDIYIEDIYPQNIYGYVAIDPGQPRDPAVPHHTYMVMDKDYTRFAKGDAAGGLAAERVTAAHEYNHVLQNVYDYAQDVWMFEATAVYMENKVYPDIDDYLNYVNRWANLMTVPMTRFNPSDAKVYGDAVWNQWLDFRYGAGVVRAAWEGSVAAANFAPSAYSNAVAAAGGPGFPEEFDRFAAAVAEWNAPGSGFPDAGRYPDIARPTVLPADVTLPPFDLPHTTFRFFAIPVPAGAPFIRFTATLPSGVTGGVALVGRTGADPNAGTVTSNVTPIPSGGSGAVQLDNPASFGRITAVVSNSDTSRAGFDPAADDWIWTRDATGVSVSVSQPGQPGAGTGAASAVTDHTATIVGTVDPHLLDTVWRLEYGPTASFGSSTPSQAAIPAATVGAAPVSVRLTGLKARTTYHYRIVGTNSMGTSPGAAMTLKTAADRTPPALTVTVGKRQKLRKVRASGLPLAAGCSEPCKGSAQLELGKRAARGLHVPAVLGKRSLNLRQAGAAKTLRLRLGRRQVALLEGAGRLSATLVVTVADESGNRRTVRRSISLTS
jgi:hypothetical protein